MPRSAPALPAVDSRFCEWFSRTAWNLGLAAALALATLAISFAADAAPEDDYRLGEKAYRGGDMVAAMAALRRAADQGHAASQVLLAEILDRAEFNEEALALYRKAAEQGDAAGAHGLATMYQAGEGVAKDPQQAYFWFTRAAEKMHAPAIIALANAHVRAAQGVELPGPDKTRAAEWLRKAAELDYLPAVEALAKAYRSGDFGLAQDAAQAERYSAQAEAMKKKLKDAKGKKKR